MKLYERIENNNFDEIDRNRAIELIEYGNGHLVYNENYFKLQKENEELKNQEATQRKINELLVQRYSNSISLQKIKDKIEELQKEYKYLGEENQRVNKFEIELLQELIEEEK